MSTAQAAYASVGKVHVGPFLRRHDFRGTGGTWIQRSNAGDLALVNLQRSRWNTADRVDFTVNLSLIPAPWWDWLLHERAGRLGQPREYHGLWRARLGPTEDAPRDASGQWWIVTDESSGALCGGDVVHQLDAHGLPQLLELLDRDVLITRIRSGNLGMISGIAAARELAVMLADRGPGAELDRVLDAVPVVYPKWPASSAFIAWARERASRIADLAAAPGP